MKVSTEVAEFVEGRAHAVRFFRAHNESTRYQSTFWGKYGEPTPYSSYTCCLQEAVQKALESEEIQTLPSEDRLTAAWNKARASAIELFIKTANGLRRWEEVRSEHPSLASYETFTDTGYSNMNGIGKGIADRYGLGEADAGIMDSVKWSFTIDYNWVMLRLFRILQRTDNREDKIPTDMADAINRLASQAGDKPSRFTGVFAEAYFSGYLFPRGSGIQEIVGTPVGNLISPAFLLSAANEQGAEAVAIEAILNTYGSKIVLCDHPMFGDESIFRNFPNRAERELAAVKESFDALHKKCEAKAQQQGYSERGEAIDMINFLRGALKQGLVHPDWAIMVSSISSFIGRFPSFYQSSVASGCREYLGEVETDYKKATGTTSATIKGRGFETAGNSSGATEIYLDGEILEVVSKPIFSASPSGGGVVAWSKCTQIDHSSIAGTQYALLVQMARKGEEVRTLFSGNYYTKESHLAVSAPTVDSDGVVRFSVNDGKETKDHVIEPEMAMA